MTDVTCDVILEKDVIVILKNICPIEISLMGSSSV